MPTSVFDEMDEALGRKPSAVTAAPSAPPPPAAAAARPSSVFDEMDQALGRTPAAKPQASSEPAEPELSGSEYFLRKTPEGYSSRFLQDITPVRGFPKIAKGASEFGGGEYSKGFNTMVEGAVQSFAVPLAVLGGYSLATAPVATALELGGGAVLEYGVGKGAEALGATPEQARVAGTIAGFAPVASTLTRGYKAVRGIGSRFGAGDAAAAATPEPAVRPPDVTPPPDTQPPIPIRTAPVAPEPVPRVEAVPATPSGTRDLSTEQATGLLNSLLRDLESDDFLARVTADQVRNLGMKAEGLARYLQLKKGQDPQGQFEFAEQRAGRAVRGMTPADQPLEAPGLQIRTPDPVQGRLPTEDLTSRIAAGDKAARDITTTENRAWDTAIRKAEREGAENVPWDFEVRVRQGKPIPSVDEVVAEAQRKAAEAGGPWDFLAGTKTGQPFPALPAGASDKVKARITALRQRIAASEAPLETAPATQELLPWISNYIDNPPTVATYKDPRTGGVFTEEPSAHVGEPLSSPVKPPSEVTGPGVLLASPETAASTRAALKRVVARMDKYDAEYRKLLDRRQFADSESELKRIDERIAANRKARNVTPEQEDAIRRQLDELEAFTPEDLQLAAVESTTKPKPKRGYQSRFATEPGPYQREEFAASIPRYGPEGRLQDPSVPGVRPSGSPGSPGSVRGLAPAAVRGVEGGGAQARPTGPQAVPPGSGAGAAPPPEVPEVPGLAAPASEYLPVPEKSVLGPRLENKKASIWESFKPSSSEMGAYDPRVKKGHLRARDLAEQAYSEDLYRLDSAGAKNLSDAERRNLMAAGERKAAPVSERVDNLLKVARDVKDDIAAVAKGGPNGNDPLMIKNPDGSYYSWSGLNPDSYMPHYNVRLEVLADPNHPTTMNMMQGMVEEGLPGVRTLDDANALREDHVKWLAGGKDPGRMVAYLKATGQAKTDAEAINRLKFLRKVAMEKPRIHGSLERSRVVNHPFYDRDGVRVLHNYVRDAHTRLAHVREFGQQDEILKKFVQETRELHGDKAADHLEHLIDSVAGRKYTDSSWQNFSVKWRQLNAFAITTLTAVPNMFQATLQGLLKADYPTVGRALLAVGRNWGKSKIRALRSGALQETSLREMLAEEGIEDAGRIGRALQTYMKYNLFSGSERSQRVVGQAIGEEWAQKLVTGMYENLNDPAKFRRSMERFMETSHTDPAELLARIQKAKSEGVDPRNILTERELLQSGKMMSDLMNFRSAALDNPEIINNPLGHMFWQFKNWIYHVTRTQYNEIARAFNEGIYKDGKFVSKPNEETWRAFRHLMTLAVAYPMAGATASYVRELLKSGPNGVMESWEDDKDNLLKAYLRAAGQAGVFAAVSSALEASTYGKLTETAAGPSFGRTAQGVEAVARDLNRLIEKEGKEARPYSLAQFIVKNIPAVGNWIYPHVKDEIKDAIQGGAGSTGTTSRRGRGRSGRPSRRTSR